MWCMPLTPALEKQRQMDLGLLRKVQSSQGHVVKLHLTNKKDNLYRVENTDNIYVYSYGTKMK